MKETDFLNDWWNSSNTANPTFQDAIDWAERRHLEEISEVRQNVILSTNLKVNS